VYAEDDAIITPELRQSFLDKSGIRLVKGVKAGHGINLEAREEVMEAVMEYVEQFWV
jgi:pimeloyl-ACP methyl ester carboxylesterase